MFVNLALTEPKNKTNLTLNISWAEFPFHSFHRIILVTFLFCCALLLDSSHLSIVFADCFEKLQKILLQISNAIFCTLKLPRPWVLCAQPLSVPSSDRERIFCAGLIVCFASADTYDEEEHSNEVETHGWQKFLPFLHFHFVFFCSVWYSSRDIFSFYYMIAISFCRACLALWWCDCKHINAFNGSKSNDSWLGVFAISGELGLLEKDLLWLGSRVVLFMVTGISNFINKISKETTELAFKDNLKISSNVNLKKTQDQKPIDPRQIEFNLCRLCERY